MIPHIVTNQGLQVVLRGDAVTVAHSVKNFNQILDAIRNGHDERTIEALINITKNQVIAAVKLSVSLSYANGVVYHNGAKLQGYAVSKLVKLIEDGVSDFRPLANFLTKVQANPTPSVIQNLYEFLEFGNMPITANGDFLAYKAIKQDWKDIHSGQFLNTIGTQHVMPRLKVDPDRNQTCSNGFHVCSWAYLPHFAHANGRVVICQINPADVVAIPADYNNTKMRVAAYRVIDEVSDYYRDKNDILSTIPVWSEEYAVYAKDVFPGEEDQEWELVSEENDYEIAVESANEALTEDDYDEVKVENSAGEVVYFKKA